MNELLRPASKKTIMYSDAIRKIMNYRDAMDHPEENDTNFDKKPEYMHVEKASKDLYLMEDFAPWQVQLEEYETPKGKKEHFYRVENEDTGVVYGPVLYPCYSLALAHAFLLNRRDTKINMSDFEAFAIAHVVIDPVCDYIRKNIKD